MIQARIDEVWKIKQNLDQKIAELPAKGREVELPPIIVNAKVQAGPDAAAMNRTTAEPVPEKAGSIISINEQNNFVIVDLGEGEGSHVGKQLKAYRGNNAIADLEVIQVRKDISAADIKSKSTVLRVGDIVR